MKKITALALTSAMVLSLAACGGSSSDTKKSDSSKSSSKSDIDEFLLNSKSEWE